MYIGCQLPLIILAFLTSQTLFWNLRCFVKIIHSRPKKNISIGVEAIAPNHRFLILREITCLYISLEQSNTLFTLHLTHLNRFVTRI